MLANLRNDVQMKYLRERSEDGCTMMDFEAFAHQWGVFLSCVHLLFPIIRRLLSAARADAGIVTRALFERSELVRALKVGVRSIQCGQAGRQWFWPLLPKHKVARLPGRTSAIQKTK